MSEKPHTAAPDLHRVREEIRGADEALVRKLAASRAEPDAAWAGCDLAQRRIALGETVAACKFAREPDRFRALARAGDAAAIEHAITDARMEEAVLERVRRHAREIGCNEALVERMTAFYRNRVIRETKRLQVRLLEAWGGGKTAPLREKGEEA